MIREYHRPQTLEEALQLLARPEPVTVPLGGGSALNRPSSEPVAVVDLQALGLDKIGERGNFIDLGATLTLQALLDAPALPAALKAAVRHEATYNLRGVATVAGTLVSAGGRSPFAAALLALDAVLSLMTSGGAQAELLPLGDFLPLRAGHLRRRLIVHVTLPLNVRLSYEYVARTPADQPVVCVAAAAWPSGRTRVVVGGFGAAPRLAFDGTEAEGVEAAVRSACSAAGDAWASAEYRQEAAGALARRCLAALLKL